MQGLVKGALLCFRNLYFYFGHGESTSTASQVTSPASQKSKDLNKVLLLLQDLGIIKLYYQPSKNGTDLCQPTVKICPFYRANVMACLVHSILSCP